MNMWPWASRWLILMRRELKVKASYRLTTTTSVVSLMAGLLSYELLGSTAVVSETSATYGMSLASFLVSGVAFSPIITSGLGLFSLYLTPANVEEIMVTPIGLRQYLLSSSSFTVLTTLATAVFSFTAATLLFRLDYSYNAPLLVGIILLGIVTSIGLGFMGLGFQLVYKQSGVLSWLLYTFTGLLGNMIVPVQILPGIVQSLSFLTPQYYFFTGIRIALGSDVAAPAQILEIFVLYALVSLGLGLLSLDRGLRTVRLNGTHRWT